MYTSLMNELDNQAKLLWIIHRELSLQPNKRDIIQALDVTLRSIDTVGPKVPLSMTQVRAATAEALRLGRDALSVIQGYGSIYTDPQVVVEGLLTVARARLQWASWAVEQANDDAWVPGEEAQVQAVWE